MQLIGLQKNEYPLLQLQQTEALQQRHTKLGVLTKTLQLKLHPPTGTHMTQGASKNPLTEDKQDLSESETASPASESRLPERQARAGFTTTLAKIVELEEPKVDEADRSIGNYEFHDEEWESWKAGPDNLNYEDEYEVGTVGSGSDSDETQSLALTTASASTRFSKLPPGPRRHTSISKSFKPHAGKTKATGGSKRKRQDLDVNSDSDTESDSESDVEGEGRFHFGCLACADYTDGQILCIRSISPAR